MPDPWEELTDSARDALMKVAKRMSEGLTGRIIIDCTEGGVGNLEITEKVLLDTRPKRRKT